MYSTSSKGIRDEDTEVFTNPVRALEAIYVVQSGRMQIW
jgi:hypothetical protein